MNTIKTVGDLKKSLSAYPDDLVLEFITSDCRVLYLKTDIQITMVSNEEEEWKFLEISLVY